MASGPTVVLVREDLQGTQDTLRVEVEHRMGWVRGSARERVTSTRTWTLRLESKPTGGLRGHVGSIGD